MLSFSHRKFEKMTFHWNCQQEHIITYACVTIIIITFFMKHKWYKRRWLIFKQHQFIVETHTVHIQQQRKSSFFEEAYSKLFKYSTHLQRSIMAIKFASYFKKSSSTTTNNVSKSSKKQQSKNTLQVPSTKLSKSSSNASNINSTTNSSGDKKKVKVVRVSFVNKNGNTFQMNWMKILEMKINGGTRDPDE